MINWICHFKTVNPWSFKGWSFHGLWLMAGLAGGHDVFISHRGPDSKKTLVGYFHNAFHQVGLRCFLDSVNLHEGTHSWASIHQAIQSAPVCLAVFTKDYAASSWCLKELHAMLQNADTTVFPIFYHVKPSDVGFPENGLLKEGFQRLRSREDDALVQQWRDDLEMASKIMGLEYSEERRGTRLFCRFWDGMLVIQKFI